MRPKILSAVLLLLDAPVALAAPAALVQQVVASDGGAHDQFGWSVAVDGDTALVGAEYATVAGNEDQGAVYVFTRSNGVWTETQKLVASDGAANAHFGTSVALDGAAAIIGADNAEVDGVTHRGAAYVFTYAGGNWSEAQRLASDDGVQWETFGYAVAIQGDIAFVGNHGANVGANNAQGSVYVFTDSGGVWSQTQKLVADDGIANDLFGFSIALDGTRALIGADNATIDGRPGQGAAYLFESSGGVWKQADKFVAGDGAEFDAFGWSVALEGGTALIGARGVSIGDNVFQGAAYVFVDDGAGFGETQKLVAHDAAAGVWFGDSVALRGNTALIGAPSAAVDDNDEQGAAYVFNAADGVWSESRRLVASDGSGNAHFGNAVALVSENSALIGADTARIGANSSQGAAYFFDVPGADVLFADGFDAAAR